MTRWKARRLRRDNLVHFGYVVAEHMIWHHRLCWCRETAKDRSEASQ